MADGEKKYPPKIKLTGLWERQTDKGQTYYVGNLNAAVKLVMFKNRDKKGPKDPDWVIFMQESTPPAQTGGGYQSGTPHGKVT